MPTFNLSEDTANEGRFNFEADNNEIMFSGEGYEHGLAGSETAVRSIIEQIRSEKITIHWPNGRSEEV